MVLSLCSRGGLILYSWKKYLVFFSEISYRWQQDHAGAYAFPDTPCFFPHFSMMRTIPVLQLWVIHHRVPLSMSPKQDSSSLVSSSQGTNASMHAHMSPVHSVKCHHICCLPEASFTTQHRQQPPTTRRESSCPISSPPRLPSLKLQPIY